MNILLDTHWSPNPLSARTTFQWALVRHIMVNVPNYQILNVGCCDDPMGFGFRVTHFDYDDWGEYFSVRNQKFVQGDAHNLGDYFEEDQFHMVLLGDILEHCPDPQRVLKEAVKVSNSFVAATIWEEWRLPREGLNTQSSVGCLAGEATAAGYYSIGEFYESQHPEMKYVEGISHLPHLWRFTDQMILQMLMDVSRETSSTLTYYQKAFEVNHDGHNAYNWLVLLGKGLR